MLSSKSIDIQKALPTCRIYAADTLRLELERSDDEIPTGLHPRFSGGRYQIDKLLGVGGNGSVYRAYDALLEEFVAIKVMHPSLAASQLACARFANEVRLARRVSHRNVARTFDLGDDAGVKFLTMELIDGEPLYCMLRSGPPLPPLSHVLDVGIEICNGLSAIHGQGVVHCDLKPDNILLTRTGRVVITDFGIARELRPTDSSPGASDSSGTPEYMAPEQVEEGAALDCRTDIYSLGVILYELLTGVLPFVGTTPYLTAAARLFRAPPDPRLKRPGIPQDVAQVVLRCLSRQREDRFASAAELGRALQQLVAMRPQATVRRARDTDELRTQAG